MPAAKYIVKTTKYLFNRGKSAAGWIKYIVSIFVDSVHWTVLINDVFESLIILLYNFYQAKKNEFHWNKNFAYTTKYWILENSIHLQETNICYT